jgi:hypothetical protein
VIGVDFGVVFLEDVTCSTAFDGGSTSSKAS